MREEATLRGPMMVLSHLILRGAVGLWIRAGLRVKRLVQVIAVIVIVFLGKSFSLTVPLSTQQNKLVPANLMLG